MPTTKLSRLSAASLLIAATLFSSTLRAESLLDRLPFKVGFSGGINGTHSGRIGRPLRPIEQMDFNNREVWDKHPYPGPKLTLTFPF